MGNREARLYGRIGGLTAWAHNDTETMVGPAHNGFRAKFEREVDPDGVLDPQERAVRADRARRAYMLTLAAKSAASRREKATKAPPPSDDQLIESVDEDWADRMAAEIAEAERKASRW